MRSGLWIPCDDMLPLIFLHPGMQVQNIADASEMLERAEFVARQAFLEQDIELMRLAG